MVVTVNKVKTVIIIEIVMEFGVTIITEPVVIKNDNGQIPKQYKSNTNVVYN